MGNRKRKTNERSSEELNDYERNREEWELLSVEILRLKCLEDNLKNTGKKPILVGRLFEHFNINENNANTAKPTKKNKSRRVETVHANADNNGTEDENVDMTISHADPAVTQLQNEMRELKDLVLQSINANNDRCSVTSKNKTDECRESEDGSGGSRYDNSNSVEKQNEPVRGFVDIPGMNNLFNTSNTVNNPIPRTGKNPFKPPAIKTALLLKIKKGEYVDFDELIPPPPGVVTEQNYGITTDPTRPASLVLKPTKSKSQIRDLANWFCAWNNFVQATLHFNPEMHFSLFSYQKLFARMCKKFNFDSCYAYDKNCRTQIASQKHLEEDEKTVFWEKHNEELYNLFLSDQLLPACFTCNGHGHYASSCPFQDSLTKNPQFRNGYQQQQPKFNNNTRPQYNNQSRYTYIKPTANQNHNKKPSCNRWNQSGFCQQPPCTYPHVCNKCFRDDHRGFECSNRTNTPFRPAQ